MSEVSLVRNEIDAGRGVVGRIDRCKLRAAEQGAGSDRMFPRPVRLGIMIGVPITAWIAIYSTVRLFF